ncbi:MAG TPA: hypothetical protein VIH72_05110 [Candidatus Acidoferrales bacterium]|jgi:hypothetical protein
MKACFLAMLSLLVASSLPAQLPFTEKQVVAYAKSIDVNALDPSLPSQRLEDWLQSGPPHAQIGYWSVEATCDLKPGSPSEEYPLCVRIGFSRNGEGGFFLVQVGTTGKGIVGHPQLYGGIGVFEVESSVVMTGSAERLSDLPALLDQPAITDGVRKLYEEIVARHPIGIPAGAEMAIIWPLLSRRLTEQLQTAQACQDDYARQHATTDRTPKPAWLKSGFFSGEDNHASPIYALVQSKEKQNDGSFLVYVDLEHDYIDLGHGSRAFYGNNSWRIATRVVSEKGKFVVDDVRVFDGFSDNGHSHLLSNSFAGCDGPHWIGVVATNK